MLINVFHYNLVVASDIKSFDIHIINCMRCQAAPGNEAVVNNREEYYAGNRD